MKSLTGNGIRNLRTSGFGSRGVPFGLALLLALALLLVASLVFSPPLALSAERYTVSGSNVSIYNLAGEVRVEAYQGPEVVVEVTRAGRNAGDLRIESGPHGVRQALRVIYPAKHILYPRLG